MHVRLLNDNEIIEKLKLWSVSFLSEADLDKERQRAETSGVKPEPCYGCFTGDGKLMASIVNNQLSMRFEGQIVKLGGVGGVATYPEYRRSGAVREIFKVMLEKARAEGELFSGLYPFSHEFYRKFGYELAHVLKVYTFPVQLLKKYAEYGRARMLLPEDDREYLRPVFERFAERLSLIVWRNDKQLLSATASDPFAKNIYSYVLEDNGNAHAYVCFRKKESTLLVTDYAYTCKEGLYAIFGLLFRMGAQFRKIEITVTDDFPLPALIDSPYELECELKMNYMMRALDCERVLKLMSARANTPFTVRVTDEFLPANSGAWRVFEGGVSEFEGEADLETSIMTFSQLALGFLDIEAARLKRDVVLRGNERALASVFIKKPGMAGVYF